MCREPKRKCEIILKRRQLDGNLDFVDDEINGGILTVINEEQFARVGRLTKDCVRSTAETMTQHRRLMINTLVAYTTVGEYDFLRADVRPLKRSIDPSIHPSIDRSINQSINQSIKVSIYMQPYDTANQKACSIHRHTYIPTLIEI